MFAAYDLLPVFSVSAASAAVAFGATGFVVTTTDGKPLNRCRKTRLRHVDHMEKAGEFCPIE